MMSSSLQQQMEEVMVTCVCAVYYPSCVYRDGWSIQVKMTDHTTNLSTAHIKLSANHNSYTLRSKVICQKPLQIPDSIHHEQEKSNLLLS